MERLSIPREIEQPGPAYLKPTLLFLIIACVEVGWYILPRILNATTHPLSNLSIHQLTLPQKEQGDKYQYNYKLYFLNSLLVSKISVTEKIFISQINILQLDFIYLWSEKDRGYRICSSNSKELACCCQELTCLSQLGNYRSSLCFIQTKNSQNTNDRQDQSLNLINKPKKRPLHSHIWTRIKINHKNDWTAPYFD